MLVTDSAYCNPFVNLYAQHLGGVDLYIFKSSQGNYNLDTEWLANVTQAKNGNYPFGAFHYDDPMTTAASQLKWFTDHKCHETGLKFIALDFEKERPSKDAPPFPKASLESHIIDTWDRFATIGLPMLFYSRPSWVNEFAPGLWPWLKEKFLWMATYPGMLSAAEWLKLKSGKKIPVSWADLTARLAKLNPLTLTGYDLVLWQFTGDTFTLPGSGVDWKGIPTALDVNTTPMTCAEFLAHIGAQEPIPKPPEAVWPLMPDEKSWAEVGEHLGYKVN